VRLLAGLLLAAAALAGDPVRLTVLHTNDLHGQLDPLPPSPVRPFLRDQPAGGYAHVAAMVRAARKEAADAGACFLLFDGGDIFQGTPVGNETRGAAVIEAMNALDYDAGALGNHEFDFGVANLRKLVKAAKHPVLAANVSGLEGVKPYVLLAPPRAPCRIGVIGLLTPETPHITAAGRTRGVRFAAPAPVVRALMKEVEADLWIVVSHLGRDDDRRLAREVEGIALILGGHSHTPIVERVDGTLIVQTHARGLSLGRADLVLDPAGWKVQDAKGQLLPVDPRSAPADPDVKAIIEKHGRELDARLGEVVGELAASARRADGTAGNWMADVIRRVGEAEIAFTNRGGIRADLEKGAVTLADCYRFMPFENDVVSMDLTGAEIQELLERHLRGGDGPYRLEWSGLVIDVAEEDGRSRMVAIEVGDRGLEASRTYRVATNSFLATGGDGFGTFRSGRNLTRTGVLIRDAIAADLRERSPVTPPAEPRVRTALAGR